MSSVSTEDVPGRDRDQPRPDPAQVRAEIRRLRSERREAKAADEFARLERAARIRLMLRDTHSRNP